MVQQKDCRAIDIFKLLYLREFAVEESIERCINQRWPERQIVKVEAKLSLCLIKYRP
jgi:hypothetical protein